MIANKVEVACEKHGPYLQSRLRIMGADVTTMCPKCSQERDEGMPSMSLTASSGIGMHHAARSIKGPLSNFAVDFMASEKQFAILTGSVGTGKTQCACDMIAIQTKTGSQPVYVTEYELSKEGVMQSFDSLQSIGPLGRLKRASLLVIDEIGAYPSNETMIAMMLDVIDRRWRAGKKTVLVSNLSGRQLAEHLGERAADRIRSSVMAKKFIGESLRKQA